MNVFSIDEKWELTIAGEVGIQAIGITEKPKNC